MSRLETGLLIIALALVGALRVLVVTGRYVRATGHAIVRLVTRSARLVLAWNRSRRTAREDRKVTRLARALRENNHEVIVQFTNKPRFPQG